jgi:hypothetical protein
MRRRAGRRRRTSQRFRGDLGQPFGAHHPDGGSRVCADREGICGQKTAHDGEVDGLRNEIVCNLPVSNENIIRYHFNREIVIGIKLLRKNGGVI